MPRKLKADYVDNDTISDVFRYLVKRSGKEVLQIAADTKLSATTLYALHSRKSTHANIRMLKVLADYFGEELTIFCGLKQYRPIRKLTAEQERLLAEYDTLTEDAKTMVMGQISRLRANPENLARLI